MTGLAAPSTVVSSATEPLATDAIERWRWAVPFVVIGSVAVVAGGLVAAVTGPTDFEHGSWLAAFLVLVGGVAFIALGAGQAWLTSERPSERVVRLELGVWNAGVAATIVGTLVTAPWLTTIGGLATLAALAVFLRTVLRPRAADVPRWAWRGYVAGVGVLLVSTPIGLLLAWIRAG